MAWEKKAAKMGMGKFVRAKAERMVLVTFQGAPLEGEGKNFKQEVVDELQFPVKFYDERSVGEKFQPGEAVRIVLEGKGEDKMMPVQGGPLLRCLMEEHNEESIMERTFILQHRGQSRETSYKLLEVRVPKGTQSKMVQKEEEEEGEEEPEPTIILEKLMQDEKKKEKFSTPETVKRAKKATIVVPPKDDESIAPKFDSDGHMKPEEEDKEKAKFDKEVAKRTKARKTKATKQDPPDEPNGDIDEDARGDDA